MKEYVKNKKFLFLISMIMFACCFVGCTKTSDIVSEHINEPVAITGNFDYYKNMENDQRASQCKEKHIVVEGVLDKKYTNSIYYIGSKKQDGFYISCTFDAPPEDISEGDTITVDGVCVYSFSDELSLYGCTITKTQKPESVPTEEQTTEGNLISKKETSKTEKVGKSILKTEAPEFDFSSIPEYSGNPYEVINDNVPFFSEEELTTSSYEEYADLDSLGRCGVCVANIGTDLMPTEERGKIGNVKPSGWNQEKYPGLVDGNYLYNRCHLIGYQLTGENDNTSNLITGTRYLNTEGMLPFENMVADYIKETNHHVLYRVTPYFEGDNLLAKGVLMEAKSVEDDSIEFCVFCYNVQPKVIINYSDGSNHLEDATQAKGATTEVVTTEALTTEALTTETSSSADMVWIPTHGGKKYHSRSGCSGMKEPIQVTEEEAISRGYTPCKRCH